MKKFLKLAALLAVLPFLAAASYIGPGKTVIIEPTTLTVDTNAYATGDLIGKHTGGYLTFANMCRVTGAGGKIVQAVLIDQAAQSAAIDLVLFSTVPSNTTFTDNSALDISDSDTPTIVAIVNFASASYKAFADNSAIATSVLLNYACVGTTTLYGALVSRGSPTYAAATDLTLRLVIERD